MSKLKHLQKRHLALAMVPALLTTLLVGCDRLKLSAHKSQQRTVFAVASSNATGAASVEHATGDNTTINKTIPVVVDPAGSVTYTPITTSVSNVRIADRFYAGALLTQVFGPSAASLIGPMIQNNPAAFGGPCDLLGQPGVTDCAQASLSQANITPISMPARESFATRTCEGIEVLDTAIAFAAKQVTSADPTQQAPADADVDTAYGLFAAGALPSTDAHSALMTLMTTVKTADSDPMTAWRTLFLTLCLNPQWQVL